MLLGKIDYAGLSFMLAQASAGKPNAVTTDGQTIHLPAGNFNRLYLLAAAANGDQKAEFKIGDRSVTLSLQDWTGFVGQWDDRIWKTTEETVPPRSGRTCLYWAVVPCSGSRARGNRLQMRVNEYGEMVGIRPGYIKRADIGWFASHRHDAAGATSRTPILICLYTLSMCHRARQHSHYLETTTFGFWRQLR